MDNGDPGYVALSGEWPTSTAMGGHYGPHYAFRSAGTGANVVRWTPNLPAADWHTVYTRWTAGSNRAPKALYSITHASGTINVTADQRRNGGKWIPLGCWRFEEGVGGYVELSDRAAGYVIADAVMWSPGQQGVIVDNKDSGFSGVSGSWPTSGKTGGYYSTNYAVHGTGTGGLARWTPNLPETGSWAVYARWTSGTNRSRKVAYTVNYDGGTATVGVNQRGFGGEWNLLGTFPFQSGQAGNVELASSPLGCVIADAVMWQWCDDAALIVDNTDPEFTEQSGTWPTSSYSGGYYGANYAYHRSGGAGTVRWTPNVLSSGDYMVYARWTAASNRSRRARYTVHYNGGTTTVTVGHNKNGGKWWPLGVFPFAAGASGYVELSNHPGGMVVADALMWAPVQAGLIVDNTDPGYSVIHGTWPTSTHLPCYYGANYAHHGPATGVTKVKWTPNIATGGTYAVYARWTSHPSRSRKARYRVHHVGGMATAYLNQRGFGGEWVHLGDYDFDVGTSGYVDLSASPEGNVCADAIMWVLLAADPAPAPPLEDSPDW